MSRLAAADPTSAAVPERPGSSARRYLHDLLARYVGLFLGGSERVADVDPPAKDFSDRFPGAERVSAEDGAPPQAIRGSDYVLLNGTLHYERDIQSYLDRLREEIGDHARLIIVYYSALWRPATRLATALGWRTKTPELNWLSHSDVRNLLHLADFAPVLLESKVLLPVWVPLISEVVNRYLAPLPGFRLLCMVNLVVARPVPRRMLERPSVSVVVPARNEAGNVAEAVRRLPAMGPDDELIFVEGGSTDDTWARICAVKEEYAGSRTILATRQDGRGKGDAVRKGFGLATREILMILDADLSVAPEDLVKFYDAIVRRKGEFVNGSRLVYPMERRAMRFLNLLGNKFFASAFSFVLGQELKDTLCGTKVLSREHYERIARHRAYFGDFDPFGDFDLIFGAARLGLKIVEVPIRYRERTYGTTNISRWRHGVLLLAMLIFAGRRLKFV